MLFARLKSEVRVLKRPLVVGRPGIWETGRRPKGGQKIPVTPKLSI